MYTVTHRRPAHSTPVRRNRRWLRVGLISLGAIVGLFLLLNIGMAVVYRGKVLPGYSVAAIPVGSLRFGELDAKVPVNELLPGNVTLKKDDTSQQRTPAELGVAVDWTATKARLTKARTWLPAWSLVSHHSVAAEPTIREDRFTPAAGKLAETFVRPALPERIVFEGEAFSIAPPAAGYELDQARLKTELIRSLEFGQSGLTVPVRTTTASGTTGQLNGDLGALQKQLGAHITFKTASHTKQLSRADIGRFYEPSGQTMQLSDARMSQVVGDVAREFGITAVNQNNAVSAAKYALSKSQPVTFQLAAQGVRIYRYCTAVKGVAASALPEYRLKLAAVYGDPKGWIQGGATMVYAESGCDFTAWLSAPAFMTGFGSICDNYYSCRVGSNVVVNYDRWMGATDPWNAAGGTLEDYRVMVINHETGHWLGFDHRTCPGAGQPAPVMQQQSISLQGCTFNPWPTPAEIASL